MKRYDIAFIGLGSIGKRHLLNVCSLLESRGDTYVIDLYRSDLHRKLPNEIVNKVNDQKLYSSSIPNNKVYDIVFITNPTSMHYEAISKFIGCTKSFFIEKPIFDSTEVDENLFGLLVDTISYVACPLRYSPVLQYVKEKINYHDAIAVRAISSSYLPDWRPEKDYRNCYSANRDLGGGVGIDLIHEWDYLTFFFGMPHKVFTIQSQLSSLEINSDDIAIYIAQTKKQSIELHLDYFGRKSIRNLELFMQEETIHCDILNGQIKYLNSGLIVKLDSDRNIYHLKEIEHFFDIVDGKINNDSTVNHAYLVLKLTKGIL